MGATDSVIAGYLSADAAQQLDDAFIQRMQTTMLIVGWKLAQCRHLGVAYTAEVLACAALFDDARAHVEM